MPFINPKSYSNIMSKGRSAWRYMHFRYRHGQERFLKEYNQQRRVEAFFSRLKRRFGPSLRSRIGTMPRKEVWLRILILNILVVAGERIEEEFEMAG